MCVWREPNYILLPKHSTIFKLHANAIKNQEMNIKIIRNGKFSNDSFIFYSTPRHQNENGDGYNLECKLWQKFQSISLSEKSRFLFERGFRKKKLILTMAHKFTRYIAYFLPANPFAIFIKIYICKHIFTKSSHCHLFIHLFTLYSHFMLYALQSEKNEWQNERIIYCRLSNKNLHF